MPVRILEMNPRPDGFDIVLEFKGRTETLSLSGSESMVLVAALQNALNAVTAWSAPEGMWPAAAVATGTTEVGPMIRVFLAETWYLDFAFPDDPDTRTQLDRIRAAAPQVSANPDGDVPFQSKPRN